MNKQHILTWEWIQRFKTGNKTELKILSRTEINILNYKEPEEPDIYAETIYGCRNRPKPINIMDL